MQKRLATALALSAGLSIHAATAQDASQWTGPYVGLNVASNDGDMAYSPSNTYDLSGTTFGLLAGYDYAFGAFVVGGELVYNTNRVDEVGNSDFGYESSADVKLRFGYGMDSLLIYATAGKTFTKWDEGGNGPFDGDGNIYGIGVDYMVSPKIIVGAEYLARRDLDSPWNTSGDRLSADYDTFSIRAAFKF